MTATNNLAGADLALWVARIVKLEAPELAEDAIKGRACMFIEHFESGDDGWWTEFAPHEDWAQGGPLLDDYAIGFHPISDAEWQAEDHITCRTGRGPTPLIAAMRALVASVYGDTVPEVAPCP